MKILQVNNHHYLLGGSEKVYFETSKLLKNNGHKVSYFSTINSKTENTPFSKYFVNDPDYETKNPIKKVFNSVRFCYSIEAKNKLDRLLKEIQPDIVHLHIFYGNLTSSILPVIKNHNIPIVMSVHEYKMLCPISVLLDTENNICEKCPYTNNHIHCIINKCNNNSVLRSSVSAIETSIRDRFFPYSKYVDKFIMVSNFILQKHIQYKPSLLNKSVQIYNFLDLEEYKYNPDISRTGYLYFGRLSREKGIKTLIRAFEKLPSLSLLIAGSGPQEQELKKIVRSKKIANIKFLGSLNKNAILKIVGKSKFVIIPSEWYENNPLAAIESLLLGVPIIGANIGGIPELISNNKNGFLFEARNVNDLYEKIKKSEKLSAIEYNEICNNARTFATKNFDSKLYYKKLMLLYDSLVHKKTNS